MPGGYDVTSRMPSGMVGEALRRLGSEAIERRKMRERALLEADAIGMTE